MKALVNIASLVKSEITFKDGVAYLNVKLVGGSSKDGITGPLTLDETKQISYAITRVTNGAIDIQGAEDILSDVPSFNSTLDKLQKVIADLREDKANSELEHMGLKTRSEFMLNKLSEEYNAYKASNPPAPLPIIHEE